METQQVYNNRSDLYPITPKDRRSNKLNVACVHCSGEMVETVEMPFSLGAWRVGQVKTRKKIDLQNMTNLQDSFADGKRELPQENFVFALSYE